MKKIIYPLITILLFGFTALENGLTHKERKMAIGYLEESRDHMMTTLDGLTKEQLNFRPTSKSWSIAECVEHIAISESVFSGLIKQTVADGDNPTLKDSVAMKDKQLYGLITNRAQKVKTSEQFEPSGKFGSHKETVDAFLKSRDYHIDYVKTTEDDLRNRFNNNLPFGTVDAYQLFIFTAAHTERHVLQMEEIMQSTGFPSVED